MREPVERQQADHGSTADAERGIPAMQLGPHPVIVTPRHLVTFRQCALRHHLQYRERRRVRPVAATHLAEGNALHTLMRRWFRSTADWRVRTDPAEIAPRIIADELSDEGYVDPLTYRAALDRVTGHAIWFLEQLPADVRTIAAERTFQSNVMAITGQAVRFQARLDLVIAHPDGEIEHVDFKTGLPHEDAWIQRGMERLVVSTAHPAAGRNGALLRTTTLYASAQEADSLCLSHESLRQTRTALVALTARMLTTTAPAPAPSALRAVRFPRQRLLGRPSRVTSGELMAGNMQHDGAGKEVCSHRGELPQGQQMVRPRDGTAGV